MIDLHFFNSAEINSIVLEDQRIVGYEKLDNYEDVYEVKIRLRVVHTNNEYNVPDVTFGEYIRRWLYEVKANELKPSSLDRKEQTINYQVLPYLEDIPLTKLKSDDIQHMINDLKLKYSYSTVKKAYEAVNSCLRYALSKREVSENAADNVSLPKSMKKAVNDISFFSDEELGLIYKEAFKCYRNGKRIYRLAEIIVFLVNTGLRIGECLALKWSDIDWNTNIVRVSRNIVYVKRRDVKSLLAETGYSSLEQRSTKTKNGDRVVPLNSAAIRALLSIRGINKNNSYIFSTSNGGRVYPRNIDRMFRAILNRCHIKGRGVHSLRHTFASRMFAEGVDVKTVSEVLGHSDVSITYNTYIHLLKEQRIKAVMLPEI